MGGDAPPPLSHSLSVSRSGRQQIGKEEEGAITEGLFFIHRGRERECSKVATLRRCWRSSSLCNHHVCVVHVARKEKVCKIIRLPSHMSYTSCVPCTCTCFANCRPRARRTPPVGGEAGLALFRENRESVGMAAAVVLGRGAIIDYSRTILHEIRWKKEKTKAGIVGFNLFCTSRALIIKALRHVKPTIRLQFVRYGDSP